MASSTGIHPPRGRVDDTLQTALMVDVLLVDDHLLVRRAIRGLLDAQTDRTGIKVVGEAASGEEALEQLSRLRPDVVLMDLNMPGMGGLEATRKALALQPGLKVIALTVEEDGPHVGWMLDSGVAGYLSKGAGEDELVHAIRLAMRGDRHVTPSVAKKLAQTDVGDPDPMTRLSYRERQILMLLVAGKKPGEIAAALDLNVKTVSTYKARLRDKLGCGSDLALYRMAIDRGIMAPCPSSDE
ncbi:two-component system, NarL family, invasion response regulator UvrY [Ectothiorhodospira magna]|uniref:Two-component system, NarL family, invasion response regulator UvrY n=1 Tax=Ectothiorhodospira magna TaxID=867345 RepID=A0A1H9CWF0_9GAMM|nr:response regulator [Ectothiorhodospira magna]SEQ05542.1 two-component system, NarL family, invasion response regulator UvrY [Ectothiorhodospira magna]